MVAIFGASSIPDLQASPAGLSDKTVHALVYGLLGALVLRAVARAEWAGVTLVAVLTAALISGLYGVTDELHQSFVPGRSIEALDMVADAAGASGAAGVIWAWSIIRASWREKKARPPRSPHPPL
jgi:VanZ family protein